MGTFCKIKREREAIELWCSLDCTVQEDENENTRRSSRDLITSRTGQDCLESVQVQDFNSPPPHPVGRSNYPDPDRLRLRVLHYPSAV